MNVVAPHKPPVRVKQLLRPVDERAGSLALPLLAVSIHHGVVPRDSLTEDEPRAEDLSDYKVCRAGDIVVNRMRAFQGGVGMAPESGIVSPDYLVLRTAPGLEPKFFHYLFRSGWFVGEMTARLRGIGGSDQGNVRTPRINPEDLGEIAVVVPTPSEQTRIVAFLDAETARIDSLITKKRRMIEVLDLGTESLLTGLFDPLIASHGEIPLKFVAELRVSNIDKKSREGERTVRLCNYTDVYYNRMIGPDLAFMEASAPIHQAERLALRKDDVLITKDSETPDDIAVPARVVEDVPGVVLGYHLAMLRPTAIDGSFLYWALRSRRCRDAFSLAASGVTRFGLRQDAVGRVLVPNVPRSEQPILVQQIERVVETAEAVTALLGRQIDLLAERRKALIATAVTVGLGPAEAT